ncbi:EamA family transporter [Bacillus carboniphilus]|uniref:EamA family transporter n=1 Tax=Bacillus carboniphilus TaxID=86663 RepID=A0ABY9JSG6_9BACI|nr:EamA family transporter [Bacillus carboniphilus]WLR41678.1 EamA family transporter [Bacillus carboniphilus]
MKIFILVITMTLLGALGGYFFKLATSSGLKLNKRLFFYVGLGIVLYLSGAFLNIILLKHLPYTIAFPLTSFTYIWTMVISYFGLKEIMTARKIVGTIFILLGAFLLIL